ncbi:hypothetical protein PLICRDRAFT_270357 [Plicaturopsis crispa FD-325 SS-3]|nr:hypothetical protein PLICRDRAFT_270357 [Plicaturopsis crispa FD-325 SS-3]
MPSTNPIFHSCMLNFVTFMMMSTPYAKTTMPVLPVLTDIKTYNRQALNTTCLGYHTHVWGRVQYPTAILVCFSIRLCTYAPIASCFTRGRLPHISPPLLPALPLLA